MATASFVSECLVASMSADPATRRAAEEQLLGPLATLPGTAHMAVSGDGELNGVAPASAHLVMYERLFR